MTSAEALREKLEVSIFPDDLFGENCYLIRRRDTVSTLVVDPGLQLDRVREQIESERLTLERILVTHGHQDHHANVGKLKELLRAPVGIGIDDAAQLSVEPDMLIVDQQSFSIGPHAFKAIHTPGHTPGSTCFLLDGKHLFTGDTLFPGGPGNTQKDPVRFERIISSIRERLFNLSDDTVVYPGHGRDTTIGAERPHLDEWIARGW